MPLDDYIARDGRFSKASPATGNVFEHKPYSSPYQLFQEDYPGLDEYGRNVLSGRNLENTINEYNALANRAMAGDEQAGEEFIGRFGFGGITAFHGTPHKFTKFSSKHIGKGEGAQAYGHGLYFAEDKNIATFYKKKLSGGKEGSIYKVNLPDERVDEFLDLDDYLSSQPVLNKMPKKFKSELDEILELYDQPDLEDLTGRELHSLLKRFASEEPLPRTTGTGENISAEVSEYLNSIGIKGIKYFDAGSRKGVDYMVQGGKQPLSFKSKGAALTHIENYGGKLSETGRSRNFVVFDDDLIRMIENE